MRLAFYSPYCPPTSAQPSGAAETARQILEALRLYGHGAHLASSFCTADDGIDPDRGARLQRLGERLAQRLIERYGKQPADQRPQAWITYRCGLDAIDWLGPMVGTALNIPLIVIEPLLAADGLASRPGQQADDRGHPAFDAVAKADAVVTLTRFAAAGLDGHLAHPDRHTAMVPFLALGRVEAARKARAQRRQALATRHQLPLASPWLLSVAMMRGPDKVKSYEILSVALSRMAALDWCLIVVGDGPQRDAALGWLNRVPRQRLRWLGALRPDELLSLYLSSDLYVWPAVREVHARAILEAQACGLPVVAGRGYAVDDVARDGISGRLSQAGNPASFANAVSFLLRHPNFRQSYAASARSSTLDAHGIGRAADGLNDVVERLVQGSPDKGQDSE